jgi:hypothetical protein
MVKFLDTRNIPPELIYRLCVHAADGNCGNFGVMVEETQPNEFFATVYTD